MNTVTPYYHKIASFISPDKIALSFRVANKDKFDAILSSVKSLPGRGWDKEKYRWIVPLNNYIIEQIQKLDFLLDDRILKWKTHQENKKADIQLPEGLSLYPFQKEGVAKLELLNGRALLADEMGLGKTIQAIAYMKLHPELRPAIIIVPASLKINWERELKKWLPEEKNDIQIVYGRDSEITKDIIIINYDIISNYIWKIKNPKLVIIDECHKIKNVKAERTKAVKEICKSVPHIIAISGTPIVNRPIEFYTTLSLIAPQLFNNQYRYAQEFCGAEFNGFGWDYKGSTNTDKLHEILKKSFMIRRLKKDVLKELPQKVRSIIPIELDKIQEYKKAEKDFISWIIENDGDEGKAERAGNAEAIAKINYLKQLVTQYKMNKLIDWIEDFIEQREKLVVFCVHHKVIDALIQKFLLMAVKLDGRDSQQNRQIAIDRFQNDESCRLFIGNIQAAGVGITLTAASCTAFVELGWTPGEHDQAEARVDRIGQEADSVNAYYLIGVNTIEEEIAKLIDEKRKILDAVLDGEVTKEEGMISELLKRYKEK